MGYHGECHPATDLKQESLADAKVSARQQCVYEDPIEEIYSKFAIDG